jgi:SanA protein
MRVFSLKNLLSAVKIGVVVVFALLAFPFLNFSYVSGHYKPHMYYRVESVPEKYAALVLGAGLLLDGRPSDILHDRVVAAVRLYKAGKVKKLIMSGDNREVSHNEPESMRVLAMQLGVPDEDIQPDYAGRRTYDSCWRVKKIFSQDDIVIVTQSFHLTRSLYLCDKLDVRAVGFMSDTPRYGKLAWNYWRLRDIYALGYSLKDLYVEEPPVVGGNKINI